MKYDRMTNVCQQKKVLRSRSAVFQGFHGLAGAEAMAAGCPVVVSPAVALAPEIEKYGAGVVVDGTVDALRNVLRQLLCDEARRHSMSHNGRRLILDQFTWDRVAQRMIEVYEDILKGTRLSSAWR